MTFLTRILYLSSLVLYNLILLLCYIMHLYKLVLQLNCFIHLYLIEYNCYIQFLDYFTNLVQTVLNYEHLLMFYVNQALFHLKHLENLKYFEQLKHHEYFKYLDYLNFRFVYLIFYFLNSDFCYICFKLFYDHIYLRLYSRWP